MKYVIQVGTKMLTCYGWPAPAKPDEFPPDCVRTTDKDNGNRPAYYFLGYEYPLKFQTTDEAVGIIERFSIAEAKPIRWRG